MDSLPGPDGALLYAALPIPTSVQRCRPMKPLVLSSLLTFGLALSGSTAAAQLTAAPDFTGIDHWINSPPLTMASLHGKVVLVDFWAYSCINCVRELPHVEHLYETYKDKGLMVVGVHSPEFDFEKNPSNVTTAVQRLNVTFPVAMDSGHATWSAWHNQYWPAEYLIDQNGQLIGHQYGEGGYLRMENAIRTLLGLSALPDTGATDGDATTDGDTPEMLLGTEAQTGLDSSEDGHNGLRRFPTAGQPAPNHYALTGLWRITDECAALAGSEGSIAMRFKATKLYMVANADTPITLEVTVDGKLQPPVTVQGSHLYTLFDGRADGSHLLKLHIPAKGLQVYSFSFG
ncbi:redoxin family protein [Rhodanobacter sp. DHG33]|uniref:redoxin family protein n=1 Tax=Rhodanobacter sp. DHG33 TaxID=2775921 RepID=UPI00177BF45E|nr:redoxin family protein [Rhodanobacter sp. DHG33]MBD8897354.1 redoxin domain-containing protein [Rhodanobacter sp. DHG33]